MEAKDLGPKLPQPARNKAELSEFGDALDIDVSSVTALPPNEDYRNYRKRRIGSLFKETLDFMSADEFSDFSEEEKEAASEIVAHFRFAIELVESKAGKVDASYDLVYTWFSEENAPFNFNAEDLIFAYVPDSDVYAISISHLYELARDMQRGEISYTGFGGTNRLFIFRPFDAELVGIEEADHRLFIKENEGRKFPYPDSDHRLAYFASKPEYHALLAKIAFVRKYYPDKKEIAAQLENTLERTQQFLKLYREGKSVESVPERQPVLWLSEDDYAKYAPKKALELGGTNFQIARNMGLFEEFNSQEKELAEQLLGRFILGYYLVFLKAGMPCDIDLEEYLKITWDKAEGDDKDMVGALIDRRMVIINIAKFKEWIEEAIVTISQVGEDKMGSKREEAENKFELAGVQLAQLLLSGYRELIPDEMYQTYEDWVAEYKKRYKQE